MRLDLHQPLDAELQRVLFEQLDLALTHLDGPLRDRDVHEVRKACKRMRAVLRLLREGPGARHVKQVESRIRDGASVLGPLRDARVLRDTLQHLDVDADTLHLPVLPATEEREPQRLQARAELVTARVEIEGLPWKRMDRERLLTGLTAQARRARRAWQRARSHPDGERLHAWRKQVKALRHGLGLLEGAWQPVLGAMVGELDLLQEVLGQHHDVIVLQDVLGEGSPHHDALLHREVALRSRCWQLGDPAHAAPADSLVGFVRGVWLGH